MTLSLSESSSFIFTSSPLLLACFSSSTSPSSLPATDAFLALPLPRLVPVGLNSGAVALRLGVLLSGCGVSGRAEGCLLPALPPSFDGSLSLKACGIIQDFSRCFTGPSSDIAASFKSPLVSSSEILVICLTRLLPMKLTAGKTGEMACKTRMPLRMCMNSLLSKQDIKALVRKVCQL